MSYLPKDVTGKKILHFILQFTREEIESTVGSFLSGAALHLITFQHKHKEPSGIAAEIIKRLDEVGDTCAFANAVALKEALDFHILQVAQSLKKEENEQARKN